MVVAVLFAKNEVFLTAGLEIQLLVNLLHFVSQGGNNKCEKNKQSKTCTLALACRWCV